MSQSPPVFWQVQPGLQLFAVALNVNDAACEPAGRQLERVSVSLYGRDYEAAGGLVSSNPAA